MSLSKKTAMLTLIYVVLFVFADLICENVLVIINDKQSPLIATIFIFSFLTSQVFFASLQAGLSDFFGRKKSLIISLSVTSFSLLCAFFYMQYFPTDIVLLIIALAAKGFWGNTTPISFAVIADTQKKNYRGSFAIATCSFPLAFICLIMMNIFFENGLLYFYISSGILIFVLSVCILLFKDSSDKSAHLPKNEILINSSNFIKIFWGISKKEVSLLIKELKRPLSKNALFAYLFWEISMYSIIISQVDFKSDSSQYITLAMMLGYLLGVFIIRRKSFKKVKDRSMITVGYLISFLSLIPYFILFKFTQTQNILVGIVYTLHAVGNAFLSPTILTIVAKNRHSHDQGKILGLFESVDTLAFLLAAIFVMIYSNFQWKVGFLVSFSLISFSISWFYYPIIKRLEKDVYKKGEN